MSWPEQPVFDYRKPNPAFDRAWKRFLNQGAYRLAQPNERTFDAGVRLRFGPDLFRYQLPYATAWGIRNFHKKDDLDSVAAIVVDTARTDAERYSLVLFAAPRENRGEYKMWWLKRNVDLSGYSVLRGSGSLFVGRPTESGYMADYGEITWWPSERDFEIVPVREPN